MTAIEQLSDIAVPPDVRDRMVAVRRDLHRHPELSRQEHRTAQLIADRLGEVGVDGVAHPVADTGVVGWVRGGEPGPTVLVRADIDALGITEADRGHDYVSTVEGVSHACGHDGHVAVALALAERLTAERDALAGNVVLLFQPAEERGGGARRMLDARAWPDDLTPSASLALHIATELPVGTVDIRPGTIAASAQSVAVKFGSPGGHAAYPHLTPDPVVCASAFVMAAQTIVSRTLAPRSAAVVSFGRIHGGEDRSAIPAEVELEGTIRTYDNDDLGIIQRRLRQIAEGTAATHGCTVEVDLRDDTYPACVNAPAITATVAAAARAVLGEGNVTAERVVAGADDMSEILMDLPGCYFWVGGANPARGLTFPHHSPEFDFDEDAMVVGLAVMEQAVRATLRSPPSGPNGTSEKL
ncbi:N-acetyl-L,L-diaminopimelate deacetylase [Euzebya pacifica]|uniref:N-acetyl-L,L-diaminopimelate deacetylase n=1 Tax=Euzebya pacifica TaxID=1608957 RepID=A0A346Y3E7_9ACTN|nr:M20 family metallopeptidase [Euzebya pacifica]AXV08994.1 N-acetyl-L,L-diaminopimelate deacetylase [Euzebya pacifica]